MRLRGALRLTRPWRSEFVSVAASAAALGIFSATSVVRNGPWRGIQSSVIVLQPCRSERVRKAA